MGRDGCRTDRDRWANLTSKYTALPRLRQVVGAATMGVAAGRAGRVGFDGFRPWSVQSPSSCPGAGRSVPVAGRGASWEGGLADHASDVSGHRAAGRRHRCRAVAGRPHPGRIAPRSASSSAPVDLTLENRRARGKAIYDEAVESIAATGWRSSIRRSPPRRARTPSSGAGSTSRSSTGRCTRSPASRPISVASSTWTSSGSRPAGPTTTPAG